MFSVILFLLPIASATALRAPSRADSHGNLSHYAHTHSYSPAYSFQKRDGWETVPVSDLAYKYVPSNTTHSASTIESPRRVPERRSRKGSPDSGIGIQQVVDAALKGIGKAVQVTITWYTGKDLENPSCWDKSVWAPSDDSFACAVTLDGWADRPKCFRFLELCNGFKKCIFVRVVDTCAGCAKGSKHVDLTKAAFKLLASLDQGLLRVYMRLATDPHEWHESLWGPKV